MREIALVVMAAGMGSRFGGGIKQLEPVGPSGEIIMDYSIYDAKRAGINKVIFIIRKDLEKDFREIIGDRIEKYIKVEYVFQEKENIPEGFTVPETRKKPWGTGHAILSCLGTIKEPFIVINADDFYGRQAFEITQEFLAQLPENSKHSYCMAGFVLGNTLSKHGKVTRGVCKVENSKMVDIEECYELLAKGEKVYGVNESGKEIVLPLDTPVSMSMWGFTPDFLEELNAHFREFFEKDVLANPEKAEYLLPEIVGDAVKEGKATVDVLNTDGRWFGVTYKEDKPKFVESIKKLIAKGEYPEAVFR